MDTSILHQPRQSHTGGIMVQLWNVHPHSMPGRYIEAIDLLHFCADSTADWECDLKDCNHECPWYYKIANNPPICILEAIKDCAFQSLDPESPDEDND